MDKVTATMGEEIKRLTEAMAGNNMEEVAAIMTTFEKKFASDDALYLVRSEDQVDD